MSRFNAEAYDKLYPREVKLETIPVQSAVEGFKPENKPVEPEPDPEPKKDTVTPDPIPEPQVEPDPEPSTEEGGKTDGA